MNFGLVDILQFGMRWGCLPTVVLFQDIVLIKTALKNIISGLRKKFPEGLELCCGFRTGIVTIATERKMTYLLL